MHGLEVVAKSSCDQCLAAVLASMLHILVNNKQVDAIYEAKSSVRTFVFFPPALTLVDKPHFPPIQSEMFALVED